MRNIQRKKSIAETPAGTLRIEQVAVRINASAHKVLRDIRLGRLKAKKLGMVWYVTPSAVIDTYGK